MRNDVEAGQHKIFWILTEKQHADFGMKPLPHSKLEPLLNFILVDVKDEQNGFKRGESVRMMGASLAMRISCNLIFALLFLVNRAHNF